MGYILPMSLIDATDVKILDALQRNARLTVAELSEAVGLSPSPCWRRVKSLEEQGVIDGYRAQISEVKLGYTVTAFVSIIAQAHTKEAIEALESHLRSTPEVVACHNISGRYDYLLEVVATDLISFGAWSRNKIQALPGVKEINTSFSLKPIKTQRSLPIKP